MSAAVCIKCGAFKQGAFARCEKCGACPESDQERALSIAASDHYCDPQWLNRISACVQEGQPPPVNPTVVSEYLETISNNIGRHVSNLFNEPPPAVQEAQHHWIPDPSNLLRVVSGIKQSGVTRWVLVDKQSADDFLKARNYKRPFFADVGGTIAMLIERYPNYFDGYYRYIWLSDLNTYSSTASREQMGQRTWNLEGRRIDADLLIPHGPTQYTPFVLDQPFFLLLVPNIQRRLGQLLQ